MDLLTVMDRASPIGLIPKNYPFLEKLCRIAHIGYKDQTIKARYKEQKEITETVDGKTIKRKVYEAKEEDRKFRNWHVCWDAKLHPKKRRTATGKIVTDSGQMVRGLTEHAKFCAILEYIAFQGDRLMRDAGIDGKLEWTNVLNLAIEQDTELVLPNGDKVEMGAKIKTLHGKDFRGVAKELSKEGMAAYDVTASVKTAEDDLPDL